MAISFSLGPFALPFTGTTGWLPWLIGITCLGLSILPLTLVSVSSDTFHDKEGGNFRRVIKHAPLLLFAVCTATLFDTVFISFFTIFGLLRPAPANYQLDSWRRHSRQRRPSIPDRLTLRPMVSHRRRSLFSHSHCRNLYCIDLCRQ